MKKNVTVAILIIIAVAATVVGINRFRQYAHYRALEHQYRQTTAQLAAGDAMEAPEEAVVFFKELQPASPVIHLRILQRQWSIALHLVAKIRQAKYNPVLQGEVPALYGTLDTLLDEMEDRSNQALAAPAPGGEITWRVHNVQAAINLLRAFRILETEKNWKKVRGTLKEAITDLKSAIERVDLTDAQAFEKNIPRWNLELLQGKADVKKISVSRREAERRLDLKNNLEAIIPEKGGYAPGDPIERRMKK